MSTPTPTPKPEPTPKKAATPNPGPAPKQSGSSKDKGGGKKGPIVSANRAKMVGIVIVFIIAMWGLFRACSAPGIHEKTFVIARDDSWYPSQLMGREKNMDGFTDVLIPAIAKITDLRIILISDGSSRLLPDLHSGLFDGILSGMTPTSSNRDTYLFSEPFYLYGPVLIVPFDSTVKSIKEMEGKIVGVRAGSFSVLTNVEKFPSISVINYDNITQAFADMDNNRIDGIILGALEAYSYVQSLYAGKVKVATPPLTDDGLRLITLKNEANQILIKRFNEGLKKLEESGEYDQILKDWGLIDTEAVVSFTVTPETKGNNAPVPNNSAAPSTPPAQEKEPSQKLMYN